uniref:Craniofacial development protein 2 n=2 Tax=Cacopsylla melanoneura TaxID=428564 RepID=A0A8D8UV16_9HEMI
MAEIRTKYSGDISPPIGSPGRTALSDATKIDLLKRNIRIGTWNVNSMFEEGKAHNVALEMTRLKIKIMGISETRWIGSGQSTVQNKTIYFSGNVDSKHLHGVAIMIDETEKHTVKNFVPLSPRVMLLQLEAYCGTLNLIQVYAPTADKDEEEVEQFYKEIETVLKLAKNQDVTIVMGDLNAKIGQGEQDEWVGKHGLGERNERGDRLHQFCQENSMVISNTLFEHHKRHLYTWKSPQDRPDHIVRNQIDYFMIKQRYKNSVKNAKTYPGADVGSDHSLLVAEIKVRLKNIKRHARKARIDTNQLRNVNTMGDVYQEVNENLKNLKAKGDTSVEKDPEDIWMSIKSAVIEPCRKYLKPEKRQERQDWMNDEILKLMEERRTAKTKDQHMYRELKKRIRYQCRQAKEIWLKDKCREIEELQQRHDLHNLHKKIKEFTGTNRKQRSYILTDNDGNIILDIESQIRQWEGYIKTLFEDQREQIEIETVEETGPTILKEEVKRAIESTKSGKALGPDEVPVDVLKLIEAQHLDAITALFNRIYTTGNIPREWLESTFVTLPKKPNAKKCDEYRTISLMSHTLKVFLKVIHRRIFQKLEDDISDTQFGFRNGYSTRDALFAYNVLVQRCLDINQNVYACFIDYNKAFDKVKHNQLIEVLKCKNLDSRDIRIIVNLYFNQIATVRVQETITDPIEIKRGVRQGCVLSPLLFNIYSEEIFARALKHDSGGIRVNGTAVNNLRYADDTILIAENMQDLQTMLDNVVTASQHFGLTLNTKKTKYMIITKSNIPPENLYVDGEQLERVNKYTYLGTNVTCTADYCSEIKIRIEKARAAFVKIKKMLCSRDLSLDLRVRMLKCYVFSVLYYGVETWTLNKECEKRLEAFEMWTYRRMQRISWTDHITNVEVLRRMNKEKEVQKEVKRRKLVYLGHIMRGSRYEILHLIIQGKIMGTRSVGRRRISWLKNLREWFNMSSADLFKAAVSKVRIAVMIANLRDGDAT